LPARFPPLDDCFLCLGQDAGDCEATGKPDPETAKDLPASLKE
jgi:hypothetical protein